MDQIDTRNQGAQTLLHSVPIANVLPEAKPALNIIAIHDLGSPSNWLDPLVRLAAEQNFSVRIVHFDSLSSLPIEDLWQRLIQIADVLRDAFVDEGPAIDLFTTPLLFMCHGFGGLVVKALLTKLYDSAASDASQSLRAVIKGVVFIGTPHPTKHAQGDWPRLSLLLRTCTTKPSKVHLLQAEANAIQIAYICSSFGEHVAQIDLPILTFYEGKRTRIKNAWYSSQRQYLVDKSFAKVNAKEEILLEVDSSHTKLHHSVFDHPARTSISTFIKRTSTPVQLPEARNPDRERLNYFWTGSDASSTLSSLRDLAISDSSASPRNISTSPAQGKVNSQPATQVQQILRRRKIPTMPKYMRTPYNERNSRFIGREDVLQALDAALVPDPKANPSTVLQYFSLHGLGGLGKTEVAVEFAHSREKHFDAIFWVHADEIAKLAESFDNIARSLGLVEAEELGDRILSRKRVLEWLDDPVKQLTSDNPSDSSELARWLLVFDNADQLENVLEYWPSSGKNGSILVTSRDPFSQSELTSGFGMKMLEMDEKATAQLLQSLVGETDTEGSLADALVLSKWFNGLPLAIVQLAAFIRRRQLSIKEFLQTYGEEPSIMDIKQTAIISPQERGRRSLTTIWRLESFSEHALGLLGVLSIMDPDRIGETVLTTNVPSNEVIQFPRNAKDYNEARSELIGTSLIIRFQETKHLKLHRLVQEVALDHMTDEQIHNSFQLVIQLLFKAWPEQYDAQSLDNEAWEASDEIVSHIVKLQHLYAKNRKWQTSANTIKQFVQLLQNAGSYLFKRSEWNATEPMLRMALSICESQPDTLKEQLAITLFTMAKFGSRTNMSGQQILEYSQRHHKICLEIKGDDMKGIDRWSSAESNLGMAYMLNGQYEDAIRHCEISEDLDKRLPDFVAGKSWPHFARNYRAWALAGLGRHDEAVTILQETIQWRTKEHGVDDEKSVKLAYVLYTLGTIYSQQNQATLSLETYQKALKSFQKTVGMNALGAGETYLKLAEQHAAISQPEAANAYFERALEILEKDLYHRPDAARAKHKLAKFQRGVGDEEGSKRSEEAARMIYRDLYPDLDDSRKLEDADFDEIVFVWSR